ncbi:MAG: M20/M25/M40 family metallo-hydrolase [Gemmatimonadales bacterium]
MNRFLFLTSLAAFVAVAACTSKQRGPSPQLQHATGTNAAITADDLRARLTIFAHDSMAGRESGTLGNYKATEYLAAEAERLGLEPAGTNGTYFQTIPLVERAVDPASTLAIDGTELDIWSDYAPVPPAGGFMLPIQVGTTGSLDGVQVIFGGPAGDPDFALEPEQIAGKLLVLAAPSGSGGSPDSWERYESAAGIALALLERFPPRVIQYMRVPHTAMADGAAPEGPLTMLVTSDVAARLVGESLASAPVGSLGVTIEGTFGYTETRPAYAARNVIAILRGSDPALRNEYVAIGAHTDHEGFSRRPVDHDSLRAFNSVVRPGGAEDRMRPPNDEEQTQIDARLDSLRSLHSARLDSIMNGADDDGSGSVAMLEIAEALAAAQEKPRRSILFVWHTAEEKGLLGARYFTDNPTVPRAAIVAEINMDMIGRGDAADVENGGPAYLQIIGSRRLSTELGDLIEAVNEKDGFGFEFDYQYDAEGHPQQFYCRSDHYMYARYGIPVAFLSTGSHRDYHQVTDEAQYIDYAKLEKVSKFVLTVSESIADLDHRIVVDKPRPDPNAPCRQ